MTENQREQTGERELADQSAGQTRTAVQTPPQAAQTDVDQRGTAELLETKDDGSAAGLEQRAPENRPAPAEDSDTSGHLFGTGDTSTFRMRWDAIQSRFVDQPTQAVKEADTLVTEVVDGLTRTFTAEREGLEKQWASNTEASTEDLRQAFQKYRAFFDRLLVA
ncbi:MAG: hypothetical protein ABI559_11780 [Chloroflexota bacterium]